MGIRGPHIGKAVITKTHVEDALKFIARDHIVLCRGTGAAISGNSGTTYALLLASDFRWKHGIEDYIVKAHLWARWDPVTTAGGLKLYNETDAVDVAILEPGVAGWREDEVDITSTVKGWTTDKFLSLQTKGDGTTAPAIAAVLIIVECGNV